MIVTEDTYIIYGDMPIGEVRKGTKVLWEFPEIPNTEIWYRTDSGNPIYPRKEYCFKEHDVFGPWLILRFKEPLKKLRRAVIKRCGIFSGTDVTQVILPKSIEVIESRAFMDCKFLGSIEIPENVKTIEKFAFSGCTSLKYIWAKPQYPPELGLGCFVGIQKNIPVFVTNQGRYEGWGDFENIKIWTT